MSLSKLLASAGSMSERVEVVDECEVEVELPQPMEAGSVLQQLGSVSRPR